MAKNISLIVCILPLLFGHAAVCGQDVGKCVVTTATTQIGIKEATGNNDGKEVAMYLATYRLPEGYAWCAAFVNWCYLKCGIRTKTNAMAASWFPRDKIIFIRNDKKRDYGSWRSGDAFGLRYTINGVSSIRHVGIIFRVEGNWVITIEGNTNDNGSREGIGVMKRKRHIRGIYAVSRWGVS